MEIIPAIDIIEGKCVRLTQGDFSNMKIYNEDPLEVALQFQEAGIKRLHLVDLDGARKGFLVNLKVLEKIALKTGLIIDYGGGIKTDEDIKTIFDAGARYAAIGSIAVKNQSLFFSWIQKYGSEKFLLGADVKEEKIQVNGWQESTSIAVFDFIEVNRRAGVQNIFCTDISKDGLLQGPSLKLYEKIILKFPGINLIASGGVSDLKDLDALKRAKCSGAIVGKAIYEGRIKLKALEKFLLC